MARHQFGGSLTDWTFAQLDGVDGHDDIAQLIGGVEVTFWNLEVGGTQYTDLVDDGGAAITSVISSDGLDGRALGTIPPFEGPEDISVMWADGGGPRALIVAWDVAQTAAAALGQAEVAEEQANAVAAELATVKTQMPVLLLHTGSAYPAKPAGFALAIRIGPTQPTSNVVDGDIWLQPEET